MIDVVEIFLEDLSTPLPPKICSNLPIFESDQAEVINLDNLESLTDGVEDKFDPILTELDCEIVC